MATVSTRCRHTDRDLVERMEKHDFFKCSKCGKYPLIVCRSD